MDAEIKQMEILPFEKTYLQLLNILLDMDPTIGSPTYVFLYALSDAIYVYEKVTYCGQPSTENDKTAD